MNFAKDLNWAPTIFGISKPSLTRPFFFFRFGQISTFSLTFHAVNTIEIMGIMLYSKMMF